MRYALALHGGAGTISRDLPAERVRARREGLTHALTIGREMLSEGAASLDTAEAVVRLLEDDPSFNAGKGAALTRDGEAELDASIMDGRTRACGAVAAVRTVRNPVALARCVMERTPHILLAGRGADAFAVEAGVEAVEPGYFHTDPRLRQLQRARARERRGGGAADPELGAGEAPGTVGCVARDGRGRLAAATSTGGMTNQMPGRVGDTPLIGAGNYADDDACAVSCTGRGEAFIRHAAAHHLCMLIRHAGLPLNRAAYHLLRDVMEPGDGGLIAVDPAGRIAMPYTTTGMHRAAADSAGRFEVAIWDP